MSTNGTIAVETKSGKVYSIYHHWDSYPEGLGITLLKYYNSRKSAEEITKLGDCSYLSEKLYPETKNHTFNKPEENVSVFYGRDRDEDNTQADMFNDIEHYLKENDHQEFNYLFTEGEDKTGNRVTGWFVSDNDGKSWKLVSEVLP